MPKEQGTPSGSNFTPTDNGKLAPSSSDSGQWTRRDAGIRSTPSMNSMDEPLKILGIYAVPWSREQAPARVGGGVCGAGRRLRPSRPPRRFAAQPPGGGSCPYLSRLKLRDGRRDGRREGRSFCWIDTGTEEWCSGSRYQGIHRWPDTCLPRDLWPSPHMLFIPKFICFARC